MNRIGGTSTEIREAWIEFLQKQQGCTCFITLGFAIFVDVPRAVLCLNHLIQRLNRSLFSKHYRKRGLCLTGIVVLEFKRRSTNAPNGPHFHMIVRGPRRLDVEDVRSLMEKHSARLRYPTLRRVGQYGRQVSGPRFVDVRSIPDLRGLLDYLTKELRNQDSALLGVNIGFVEVDGVVGIDQ